MESELQARDRIGVQDFVLLEDFKNEDAFLDNLRKRYKADLIYVSMFVVCLLLQFYIIYNCDDLSKDFFLYECFIEDYFQQQRNSIFGTTV